MLVLSLATSLEDAGFHLVDVTRGRIQSRTSMEREGHVPLPAKMKWPLQMALKNVESVYSIPESGL